MDPVKSIRNVKGDLLLGKKIVLGITGSVSAEEMVKVSRELIRYGADIIPVMTEDAKNIITPTSIEYATGKKPIDQITGLTEHVVLEKESDMLLISPCSANTISKIANGIGDTTVSLFALTFLGSKPILIAPAMSETMYKNPIIVENIKKLKQFGVIFIDPKMEEGKAKLPDLDTIVAYTIRSLNKKINKKILIIGGATEEPIDDIRVITNKSSGFTSVELAKAAFFYGADVKLLLGRSEVEPPSYIKTEKFRTIDDLLSMIDGMLDYDAIFLPAAISDFKTNKFDGKIKSDNETEIHLKPTTKFIKVLRERFNGDTIAFKAEFGYEKLVDESRKMIENYSLRFVIANDMRDVKFDTTKILIVEKNNVKELSGKKSNVALKIMEFYSGFTEHNG
ncbi:MAG: bifunctional phosphopantothenoylcysteine decarboxylase/phosphopantothenate--cysteine ligase CoaBC [Thermoplasmata archaeon]